MFIKIFDCSQIRNVRNEEKYTIGFGKNLKKIRLQHHLSQEHLAIDANIPTNQIGRIERGEISTGIATLYKIAKALDMEVKELFDF